MPPSPQQPKKLTACVRCRHRKVKCDGLLPCGNCAKARVSCEESAGSQQRYIQHLENRIHELEALVGRSQSQQGPTPNPTSCTPDERPTNPRSNPSPYQSNTPSTPCIGPEQPLAHEVGLLSLQAANSPKYLGPSSGVAFARLIFASAPHTQGLSTKFSASLPQSQFEDISCASGFPSLPEIHRFVAAYFDQFHHQYPFLNELHIDELVEKYSTDPATGTASDSCMLFLIIALGSRVLESQLGTDFASASYLAAATNLLADLPLHESIHGIQIMLLLVLSSFCFPGGLNAWFLTHTILASCLDLGLQRKQPTCMTHQLQPPGLPRTADREPAPDQNRTSATIGSNTGVHDMRSSIFWSAYSLDRTLCTALGRPLTLRDEAIDIEFPGQQGSEEVDLDAIEGAALSLGPPAPETSVEENRRLPQRQQKRMRTDLQPLHSFYAANLSFRFDRIVAEVKLMIHRVAQSPRRFPWPSDFEGWRKRVHLSCKELFDHAKYTLSQRTEGIPRALSYRVLPSIELKYHQCVMLLFRPSPAFPRPSAESLNICFDSASETIRIHFELHRFGQMMNSWLTAHCIFVSGITMLYCVWISPAIRRRARDTFSEHVTRCSETLHALGKTWSVAKDARVKFDRLAEATRESWRRREEPSDAHANPPPSSMDQEQPTPLEDTGEAIDWTGESFSALFDSTGLIADELGDMSGWFDLEWFETFGVEGLESATAS